MLKKYKISNIIIFTLVVCFLFLQPSPLYWFEDLSNLSSTDNGLIGFLANLFLSALLFFEENKELFHFFAHFLLMIFLSYFFTSYLKKNYSQRLSPIFVFLIVCLKVFVISFLIECLQAMLPESFDRKFDWIDVILSMLGGLIGFILFYVKHRF